MKIKEDFPQKTSATWAGLGKIGHNCQLVTREFVGPWPASIARPDEGISSTPAIKIINFPVE